MKWKEVRNLYSEQFVKFEAIELHVEGNKEFINEMSIIKAITDGKQAAKEFINCKPGQLVYSTKNEEIVIQLDT